MKINTIRTLPKKLGIAFSGGIDSSVLLDIAIKKGCDITVLVFDHGNKISDEEIIFSEKIGKKYNLPVIIGNTDKKFPIGESKEKFWSECRNNWFNEFDMPVATGHHLNDAAEWYLMTALTGNGGFYMDYKNKNVIRPLLVIKKSDIEEYSIENSVEYIIDETNFDLCFNKRNRVRHELFPVVKNINIGFLNTIKRNIIRKEFER